MLRLTLSLLLVLAGLTAGLLSTQAAIAGPRNVVAVLPMVVNATEDRSYLRDGLSDMLTSRLGRQQGLAVTRVEDLETATTEASAAREAGRAAGADWVVFGSFTRFGNGASLDLRCVRVEEGTGGGDPRSIFVQAGEVGEIIPGLDSVAIRVGEYVRSGNSAATTDVASPPPGVSPEEAAELAELRARVDALEGRVFGADGGAGDQGR